MKEWGKDLETLVGGKIDPAERIFFIEKTGVIIRWLLILAGSAIQIVRSIIPPYCFYIALPVAIAYNLSVQLLIRKRKYVYAVSYCTAVMDILVSLVLIFFAATTDLYLWYFVLLVSHAARFGFVGSIVSPVLFSIVYISGLYLRGYNFPLQTLALRATFLVITGVVSGYLAREEHRRFLRLLQQQRDIFETRQRQKEMRDMLQRYLSYTLVEELLKDPLKIRLGGVRQKVSVLFSDISGFTRLLSQVEPERVIAVLNEYLTEMTTIIFDHGGMVDKFVGDAIIGIFGAPTPSQEDALQAVRTACEMQRKLRELQQEWKDRVGEVIEARIAVNTGEVILGNIGSPKRMDYTAIGDPVNIASRLQAIADPGRVVISQSTHDEISDRIRDRIRVKDLGRVELKGKPEPIGVYEVQAATDNCGGIR